MDMSVWWRSEVAKWHPAHPDTQREKDTNFPATKHEKPREVASLECGKKDVQHFLSRRHPASVAGTNEGSFGGLGTWKNV